MLDSENKAIVEEVLEAFAAISAIPRPSTHEKAISDYLCGVFRGLGCDVRQDGANNVIADRAASPGFENAPRVILQAHMDMVCAAAEGVKFDPLQDAIRLRREGDILTAEGTSLGADDGAGVAMILYVFRHAKEIGPLRAIITTDEESGMTGAEALDPSCFSDAEYLINWDSENYDELIKGSAGSVGIDFCRKADPCADAVCIGTCGHFLCCRFDDGGRCAKRNSVQCRSGDCHTNRTVGNSPGNFKIRAA